LSAIFRPVLLSARSVHGAPAIGLCVGFAPAHGRGLTEQYPSGTFSASARVLFANGSGIARGFKPERRASAASDLNPSGRPS
jgi:hypothetical protein